MLSFKLVTILAACTTMVMAGGDAIFCTKINLTGHCDTLSYLDGTCYNLPADLEDKVKSIDLDGDGHSCTLFEDENCSGDNIGWTKHHNNLGNFNDLASSFRCSS